MESHPGRVARLPGLAAAGEFLRQGDTFLLTTHVNNDGDGVGACLALQHMLRQAGKEVVTILADAPDRHYDFLEDWSGMRGADAGSPAPASRVVVLDCPSLERIGGVGTHVGPQSLLLNVDHHLGNTLFGHVNVASTDVSSTCEAVYHLAVDMGLDVDDIAAAALYAGIVFDTGSFRYSLTTATTFEVAADLVRRGAQLDRIAQRVFGDRTFGELRQLGGALASARLRSDGRVVVMHLTHQQLLDGRADDAVTYGLQVHGSLVSVLLKEEEPGVQRASLRSREPFDVRQVAARFGGGGHVRASGCRLSGTAAEAEEQLIAVIDEHMPTP